LLVLGVIAVFVLTNLVSDFEDYRLAQLGAYLCAVAGLTVLTGRSGQVSLGHAALMAIGAYTVAVMQARLPDAGAEGQWTLPISLLAGALLATVGGTVFAVAAARLRGPYLAGATLALGVALPGVASHFSGFFKGDQGLFVPFAGPPAALGSGFTLQHWQAWISLGSALLVLFFLGNLNRSAVGRHMRAVRDDEIGAALSGLSVPRIQISTFAVSSAAAGLGGGVLAVVLQTASPGSFDLVLSLTLLSAVVIGGLGSLPGAVWGSVIVVYFGALVSDHIDAWGLSQQLASHLHSNVAPAVYGVLLIVVMRTMPGGIQGGLRRLLALLPKSHRAPQQTGGSS
ncbi:MAG: branched-chain amino acid ABC transporter permease, partial [Nocardioidaceae bacterium]